LRSAPVRRPDADRPCAASASRLMTTLTLAVLVRPGSAGRGHRLRQAVPPGRSLSSVRTGQIVDDRACPIGRGSVEVGAPRPVDGWSTPCRTDATRPALRGCGDAEDARRRAAREDEAQQHQGGHKDNATEHEDYLCWLGGRTTNSLSGGTSQGVGIGRLPPPEEPRYLFGLTIGISGAMHAFQDATAGGPGSPLARAQPGATRARLMASAPPNQKH